MAASRVRWRPLSGVLLLDKPVGPSSNDALQQARRLFRAAKAGHTGALDPLASGLLPILFGEATKLSALLLEGDKAYVADVCLGIATRTGDGEGEVVARSDPSSVTESTLRAVLAAYVGEHDQLPPMYSALKSGGRKLYELAREGQQVERVPRRVRIHALELLDFAPGRFRMAVRCSKGTYIRTLAEDLAAALGQCAHLSALRRTAAGPFVEPPMLSLGEIATAAAQGDAQLDRLLLPPAAAVADRPALQVDAAQADLLGAGGRIRVGLRPEFAPGDPVPVLDPAGRLRGLAEIGADGVLQPRRWLQYSDHL